MFHFCILEMLEAVHMHFSAKFSLLKNQVPTPSRGGEEGWVHSKMENCVKNKTNSFSYECECVYAKATTKNNDRDNERGKTEAGEKDEWERVQILHLRITTKTTQLAEHMHVHCKKQYDNRQ